MKTAFVTVVYPGVQKYLEDFFGSLSRQTDTGFDLVLLNDSFPSLSEVSRHFDLQFQEINVSGSFSTLRQSGFEQVQSLGYDLIIFGDADDVFDAKRVEICKGSLMENEAVVHDINLVDDHLQLIKSSYFQARFPKPYHLRKTDLDEYNFCGFTNTAIRSCVLDKLTFIPDWNVVDWPMFYQILQQDLKFQYIPEALTQYRQVQNSLGNLGVINENSHKTRELHYMSLVNLGYPLQNQLKRAKDRQSNSSAEHSARFWWEV